MGSFSTLNTALSGLQAHKAVIDVIGHNISNVNTDGYTRRQVLLEPSVGTRMGSLYDSRFAWDNLGVNIAGVNRIRDDFLDQKARAAMAGSAQGTRLDSILGGIETVFPEPSDSSIASKLAAFWNAFADAANSPGAVPQRAAVLAQASNVVSSLHQASADLTAQHTDITNQLSMAVARANTLAHQVADLNDQIRAATVANMDPGDLQDQRDRLVDDLTKLTGATVRQADHNQVDVMLGGSPMVSGGYVSEISTTNTGALPAPLDTLQVQGTQLRWSADGYVVAGYGGEIGAMVQGVNDVIPRYMHELDTIAGALVTSVNAIHQTGQGQDTVNDVNLDFFDPANTRADNIKLSSDVDGQPSRIALGAVGAGTLDGSIGHQLAAAGSAVGSPDALHRAMIGRLGVEAQAATTRASTQQAFVVEAENQRTSVSGVNLDEEMTNLVMSQRAYESSARLMSVVDSMLDTLINRTGAGR